MPRVFHSADFPPRSRAFGLYLLASGPTSHGEEPRPMILADYLPWFTSKPGSGQWGWHWTMDQSERILEIGPLDDAFYKQKNDLHELVGNYILCHL